MVRAISSAAGAAEKKASLREKITALKDALSKNAVQRMSESVAGRCFSLPVYQKSRNILIYISLDKEVQTESIIKRFFAMGKGVFIPIVDDENNDLLVSEIPSLDIKLEEGACGIRVPEEKDRTIVSPDIIDLAFVPGLAFTQKGTRLGRGKGYYDRLLARLPSHVMKVGLAFDFQILDFIPISQHDMGVDMVLTENETFNC